MKHDPTEQSVRERMVPGALALDGFLGHDERTLADIVAADLAELDAAGISKEALGDLLDEIHQAADAALGVPVDLYDGKVIATVIEVMGRIPCPFGDGALAHKAVVDVRIPQGTLRITPLDAHMIREHGFFQGKGSPFRVEPHDAIALYRLCREQ